MNSFDMNDLAKKAFTLHAFQDVLKITLDSYSWRIAFPLGFFLENSLLPILWMDSYQKSTRLLETNFEKTKGETKLTDSFIYMISYQCCLLIKSWKYHIKVLIFSHATNVWKSALTSINLSMQQGNYSDGDSIF